MIHPSYTELMPKINKDAELGEEPVINSRYSIVIATAKRARQIIAGAPTEVENAENKKPLSIAVEELYNGDIKIVSEDDRLQKRKCKLKMLSLIFETALSIHREKNENIIYFTWL